MVVCLYQGSINNEKKLFEKKNKKKQEKHKQKMKYIKYGRITNCSELGISAEYAYFLTDNRFLF